MTPLTQDWPLGFKTRLLPVIQGEFQVTSDANIALSTVLGSCIAVCLFDAKTGIGGMNHYLLAENTSGAGVDLKYGAHAMELLINKLLKNGADRHRLCAKIFGGSKMSGRFANIGGRNAEFAVQFLTDEGFEVIAKDVGGTAARRVNFHPVTGIARVIHTETIPDIQPTIPPSLPKVRPKSESAILF